MAPASREANGAEGEAATPWPIAGEPGESEKSFTAALGSVKSGAVVQEEFLSGIPLKNVLQLKRRAEL
jgi:hypothetical protein